MQNHLVTAVWVMVFQAQDLQIVCYAFTAFGKDAINQKKLHPDTFVQLAKQLAFQRMHKRYKMIQKIVPCVY